GCAREGIFQRAAGAGQHCAFKQACQRGRVLAAVCLTGKTAAQYRNRFGNTFTVSCVTVRRRGQKLGFEQTSLHCFVTPVLISAVTNHQDWVRLEWYTAFPEK